MNNCKDLSNVLMDQKVFPHNQFCVCELKCVCVCVCVCDNHTHTHTHTEDGATLVLAVVCAGCSGISHIGR